MNTLIHFLTPWSQERKLGKAYNQACEIIPQDDWICFMDGDTMFLNNDWGSIIYNHVRMHGDQYKLMTCYTNRIGCKWQRYQGEMSQEKDLTQHRFIAVTNAVDNANKIKDVTDAKYGSGFLMLFPKKLWNEIKFAEQSSSGTLLGIDNIFFNSVRKAGYKIGLMEDLYVLHYYRLVEGCKYKEHLKS